MSYDNTIIRKYGFRKSEHLTLTGPNINVGYTVPKNLPPVVDLRPKMPPVYDQGQEGSCVANATSGAVEFIRQDGITPARQFLYYNCRELDGTVNQDGGTTITTAIHSLTTTGICPESLWPYNLNDMYTKPSQECYAAAQKELLHGYTQIRSANDIHGSLAAGFPVAFGMQLFDEFESAYMAKTGKLMALPTYTSQYLGGHALLIVGIDNTRKVFIVRNSWGASWGMNGYFEVIQDYIKTPELASDFWSIHKI